MEIFEFKDTFCCSLFKETKYNTSVRPNLLAKLFQKNVKIECDFLAKNNDKVQYVFAKQGIENSGVYIQNNSIIFELSLFHNSNNFSDNLIKNVYAFEYDKINSLVYEVDVDKQILRTIFNGELKETPFFEGKVSDYSNVPLWIGTSNPFVQNKNYFNGFIYKFVVEDKEGVVCDIDFTNVNRFKVLDKSENGNHAYIEEYGNILLQERLNIQIAGNPLKSSTTLNQTLI